MCRGPDCRCALTRIPSNVPPAGGSHGQGTRSRLHRLRLHWAALHQAAALINTPSLSQRPTNDADAASPAQQSILLLPDPIPFPARIPHPLPVSRALCTVPFPYHPLRPLLRPRQAHDRLLVPSPSSAPPEAQYLNLPDPPPSATPSHHVCRT